MGSPHFTRTKNCSLPSRVARGGPALELLSLLQPLLGRFVRLFHPPLYDQ